MVDISVGSHKRTIHWAVIALSVALGSTFLTVFLQLHNPRILVSWHGFLHTAIANRFPGPFKTPENPFFAGEPLPYYWVHQYVASMIARVLGTHPVYAFQMITAAGLVILWFSAAAIGVHRWKSVKAGLLVGFLALGGVNPLGPAIALAKSVVMGTRLFTPASPMSTLDTTFVSEHESGELLTQPLLGALYVTADWRRGQIVPYYLDNSSRAIALALLILLVYVFTQRAVSVMWLASIAAISCAMTALSPLIGLAAVGSLCGGSVMIALLNRIRPGTDNLQSSLCTLGMSAAAALGAAAASPTYYHLFFAGGSAMQVPPFRVTLLKALALALNVIILLPMAFWASLWTSDGLRDHYRVLTVAASGLLMIVPLISLPDGTEHNLANTAQCLLVVPAVALTVSERVSRRLLLALCLPMTAATIVSYTGRPSLPVAFDGPVMHRTQVDALEHAYQWVRESTSLNAVIIADPTMPAKMSGNVSELPAFTRRTLFVDLPTYMTTPHKDFSRRRDLAKRLVDGFPAAGQDVRYLRALQRPAYLLSCVADRPEPFDRLVHLYGAPVFRDRFVAVFELAGLIDGTVVQ